MSNPNLNPILPIAGVPTALIQVLNDRFREIRLQPAPAAAPASTPAAGSAGPFQRTLLIRNTTVGADIADHVTCWGTSTTHKVTTVRGVLRKTIASDLTIRINTVSASGMTTQAVGTFTIPAATPIDTIVEFTSGFTTSSLQDESVFTWDITASDGSTDKQGVASFTIEWEP